MDARTEVVKQLATGDASQPSQSMIAPREHHKLMLLSLKAIKEAQEQRQRAEKAEAALTTANTRASDHWELAEFRRQEVEKLKNDFDSAETERVEAVRRYEKAEALHAGATEAQLRAEADLATAREQLKAKDRTIRDLCDANGQIVASAPLTEAQRGALEGYTTEYLARGVHGTWHDLATAIAALMNHCRTVAREREVPPGSTEYTEMLMNHCRTVAREREVPPGSTEYTEY